MNEMQDTILEALEQLEAETGGEAIDDAVLARRVGLDVEELREQLGELEEEGYVELERVGPVKYEVRLRQRGDLTT